jgi:C4-dicarboxylate-specific signal transduction histidine kinase
MPKAAHETRASTSTAFATRFETDPPRSEEPALASNAPEETACYSEPCCHETQTELAHANRVAILEQLSASIAHEVIEPIGATVTAAQAALRWLGSQRPDLEEARQMLVQIVRDGTRAADVVHRVRAFTEREPSPREQLDINEAIRAVIGLTRGEAVKNGVSVQMKLAEHLPLIRGDQVQLQQVILNLIINAVKAINLRPAGPRDLLIHTTKANSGGVLVAVSYSGLGVDPANLDCIFDRFFSAKAGDSRMGLSICRAIIQSHGGRLSATKGAARGTTLQFTLPAATDSAS